MFFLIVYKSKKTKISKDMCTQTPENYFLRNSFKQTVIDDGSKVFGCKMRF